MRVNAVSCVEWGHGIKDERNSLAFKLLLMMMTMISVLVSNVKCVSKL